MNKYTKIGLTALAGSLVAGSVSAATLTASGSATMSFSGGDEKSNHGNGWTMADSVTFSASGDVNDIGVTLSIELDGDAQSKNLTQQLLTHLQMVLTLLTVTQLLLTSVMQVH